MPRDPRDSSKILGEELTNEYVLYWARIQEDNAEGLVQIQVDALERWGALQIALEKDKEEAEFPLEVCFKIFDDYFFLGSLSQYTKVKWARDTLANSHWDGLTNIHRQTILSRQPRLHIAIKRRNDMRGIAALRENMDTLLHEMVHAFLMIYSVRTVDIEGITGHGPCWVKVAAAIAAEANRSFGGWCEPWDLGIMESCCSEVEAQEGLSRR